jgi:hypothetical protein
MNVFRKLWSGAYSLPIAFWAFYCAGMLACFLVSGVILFLSHAINARPLAFTVCFTLVLIYWLAASVGVWRSAGPYWRSPIWMSRIWAAAARLVIAGWMAKAVLGWVDGGAVAIVQQMAGDIEF